MSMSENQGGGVIDEPRPDAKTMKPRPATRRWTGLANKFDAGTTRKIDLSRFLQDVIEVRNRDPGELKDRLRQIHEITQGAAAKAVPEKTERPTLKPPMTVWPAALRLDQSAEYCGLSVDTFKIVCPVKPIEYTESSKGNRWLRVRLDEWLASLDPNSKTSPTRRFGEKLGG
jgi:hypothetical protein